LSTPEINYFYAGAGCGTPNMRMIDYFLGGISSNSGNEITCVYQSGLEPQNMFCTGLMPGSSSSVPAGTMTTFPLFDNHGSEDPQFLQKQVAKYLVLSGSYLPTNSSPLSQLKSSGDTNKLAACALPVNFRQREQWQYWNTPMLPVIW
jgi:hypothetical protein